MKNEKLIKKKDGKGMEEEQERKEGKDNKERSRGNWQRGRIVGDDDKQGKIGGKEGKV